MKLKRGSCGVALMMIAMVSIVNTGRAERTKHHYTNSHWSLHRTLEESTYSHLKDFEVTVPEILHGGYSDRRRRRSVSRDEFPVGVKLIAHGRDFHIELLPNDDILAQTYSVKRVKRDLATGELKESEENSGGLDCHYKGRMLSHGNKSAAISICDGLTGLLRTEEDDFILEPIPHYLSHDFPRNLRPHVVYKKKDLYKKENLHYCGRQKRHPMTIQAGDIGGIRQLSDGEMVIKTPEEIASEYEHELESSRKKRSARSGSTVERRLVVETLVVADHQFIKNHESDRVDVTTYILTVMNMVNALFHDGTLDSEIEITLVGITLLEDDSELKLDHRAGMALASFCQWQANATTATGRKPDHAILLTGIDICIDKNEPCDTLGLAQIGGMCSRSDSCTINEDMGLGLAFTVAHETGHSFGMKHDGIANSCNKRGGHIMSPTVHTVNGVFTWSSCSRRALKDFLKSGHSQCLYDGASTSLESGLQSPEELPGQTFTADDQCKLLLGADARVCDFRYEDNADAICKHLWCQRGNGQCETKYMPAAEGTSCGINSWCRRGVCVPHGSVGPDAIDGDWSKYGPWSDCTRTCGGGISYRLRHCNRPAPQYGGRYCDGEDKIYELCNTQDCPGDANDFRSQQCSEHDSEPYRRQYFSWVPYTKYWKYDFNKCELLCEASGYGFFDLLSPYVKDGTSCDEVTNDVCIEGKCTHVGCDRVLYSNATVDACGVCEGDNSTCQFISGTYTDDVKGSGYFQATTIPEGARTIRIWEDQCCTHAFIAVRSDSTEEKYYLNGNWRVNLYGDMKFAGANWKYEREIGKSEVLTSAGPLREGIIVEALILRGNPGISYSYAMHEIDNRLPYKKSRQDTPLHTYSWKEEWQRCSKSCSGGEQESVVACVEDNKYEVGNSFCAISRKPAIKRKRCNTFACPTRWKTDNWGKCSQTCGKGVQTRKITCKQITMDGEVEVRPSGCNATLKPSTHQLCEEEECPRWTTGNWSRCSRRCGRGVRSRALSCNAGDRKVFDGKCDNKTKPIFRKSCVVSRCRRRYRWLVTSWSQCSTTCGEGYRRRSLKCVFKGRSGKNKTIRGKRCRKTRKPKLLYKRRCKNADCPVEKDKQPSTTAMSKTTKFEPSVTATVTTEQVTTTLKPTTKMSRRMTRPAHQARWIVSAWQECTAACGGGRQVRTVKCMLRGKPSNLCSYEKKPNNIRSCNTNDCVTNAPKVGMDCEDAFKWCYLVPHHNTCTHRYFGQNCCKSCKQAAQLILG